MRRVILFDRYDAPIGELSPDEVTSLVRTETINGEHTLEITTERVLQQGWRIVTQDGTGKWREHVVYGTDALHASGEAVVGTYYCVWSVMHDLAGTTVSAMPGVQNPVLASVALDAALAGTSRWVRGTVTNTATGGASMYDMSGWEAIAVLLDVWGGELDVTIQVGASGVTARKVDLYLMQGSDDALRRYDFGADLKSVRRKVEDGPLYCRISPRGKGEDTGSGYGRKITIESVNGGNDWLEYSPMVDAAKLPNGSGGWEYPTLIVENSDCETPADLKAWGESVKERYCTPNVTYDVDVVQAAVEGIDMQGVSLGDVVHIVDRKFGDGIRLAGRVSSMTVNMLDEHNVKVVIGSVSEWLADALSAFGSALDRITASLKVIGAAQSHMATAQFIDELLDRINAEINATGGYTYITDGQGLRTYDNAVTDPLVGAEANQVVEISGGSIRIADSKTNGNWNWRTVIQSGKLIADSVISAMITSGYIGSVGGNYWNLDTGEFVIQQGNIQAKIGASTTVNNAQRYKRYGVHSSVGASDAHSFYVAKGNNKIEMFPDISGGWGSIIASGDLLLAAQGDSLYPCVLLRNQSANSGYNFVHIGVEAPSTWTEMTNEGITVLNNEVQLIGATSVTGKLTVARYVEVCPEDPAQHYAHLADVLINGKVTVTGTKSRVCATESYGKRLLYCYETPGPMFGDTGSGRISEDGTCYVEIDGIMSETVRTDIAYQVFLQKCGQGDLWVEEKAPTHFVVSGTPGLAFDWELKAKQAGYEHVRIEQDEMERAVDGELYHETDWDSVYGANEPTTIDDAYGDYVTQMEELYLQEIAA